MGALADNPPSEPARRFTLIGPITYPDGHVYGNGEVWERTGSCNRCGACCGASLGAVVDMLPASSNLCPYFQWDNAGQTVGFCEARCGSMYARGCCDFPSHPQHAVDIPSCTYAWTRIS